MSSAQYDENRQLSTGMRSELCQAVDAQWASTAWSPRKGRLGAMNQCHYDEALALARALESLAGWNGPRTPSLAWGLTPVGSSDSSLSSRMITGNFFQLSEPWIWVGKTLAVISRPESVAERAHSYTQPTHLCLTHLGLTCFYHNILLPLSHSGNVPCWARTCHTNLSSAVADLSWRCSRLRGSQATTSWRLVMSWVTVPKIQHDY